MQSGWVIGIGNSLTDEFLFQCTMAWAFSVTPAHRHLLKNPQLAWLNKRSFYSTDLVRHESDETVSTAGPVRNGTNGHSSSQNKTHAYCKGPLVMVSWQYAYCEMVHHDIATTLSDDTLHNAYCQMVHYNMHTMRQTTTTSILSDGTLQHACCQMVHHNMHTIR